MSFEIIISRTAVVLSCGLIVDGMTIFLVDDSIKMRMFSFVGFVCIHIGGGFEKYTSTRRVVQKYSLTKVKFSKIRC